MFSSFRLGAWPDFYPGVQFSRDPEALNQFFQQMVPNTRRYDAQVNVDAVSALSNKIGLRAFSSPTHRAAVWAGAHSHQEQECPATVSFEPGFDCPFPEGEVPSSMTLGGRPLSAIAVPQSDFMLLTKILIIIYYGDNIPDKPSVNHGQEQWRIFCE